MRESFSNAVLLCKLFPTSYKYILSSEKQALFLHFPFIKWNTLTSGLRLIIFILKLDKPIIRSFYCLKKIHLQLLLIVEFHSRLKCNENGPLLFNAPLTHHLENQTRYFFLLKNKRSFFLVFFFSWLLFWLANEKKITSNFNWLRFRSNIPSTYLYIGRSLWRSSTRLIQWC